MKGTSFDALYFGAWVADEKQTENRFFLTLIPQGLVINERERERERESLCMYKK